MWIQTSLPSHHLFTPVRQTTRQISVRMKIRPSYVLFLGILCYIKFVDSQISPNPVSASLPPNLIECYNDSFIVVPDNLLPMTLSTFLALVRKAESDPTIGQTDFRTMTAALLHRFRFDGLMLNPDIMASPGVIPYSAKGNEFSTYRLIMDYIIPDPNIYFNNYTFTRIERCTLHRMLSLSVDPWMRDDNDRVCSNLMNDNYIGKLNSRVPRDVSKLEDVEVFDAEAKMSNYDANYMSNFNSYSNQPPQRSNCPVENGAIYTPSGSLNPGLVLAGIAAGSSSQDYVDPSIMLQVQTRPGSGRPPFRQQPALPAPMPRDPYYNRNRNTHVLQQNYPPGYPGGSNYPGNGGSNNYPGNGGSSNNYPGYPASGGGYPASGYPNSGGGGSRYPGGSSYPGGSGSYPGSGSGFPGSNYPGTFGGGGGSNQIQKGWAATMSGILAQYSLLQGPTGQMDNVIGITGGWNDSVSTKYFFLNDPTPDNLPNSRIRGALDGLIMAKSIQKWSSQAGNSNNFKLSQLLTMYYSSIGVFDPNAVACNRQQRVGNVMSQTDTAYQTNNFATVLINHLPNAATIDPRNIWSYTNQVANDVQSVVTKMGSGTCGQSQNPQTGGGQTGNQPMAYPTADLYVVMDLSYTYPGLKNILQYIMESTFVNPYRSNITVLTAKGCPTLNSTLILSAQNTLDAQVSFANYSSCQPGFDFLFSLVQIKSLMQAKLRYDRQLGVNPPYNNDIPRIVIFVPSANVNIDSNTANLALNKFQDFQSTMPDTKFLYLTPGPTDRWTQFSNSTHPDVFALSRETQGFRLGINKLVQRIAEIQRRITNPTCGAHWNQGYTYNQITLTENLLYNEIQYFRVHPNYFFLSSSGSIIVQPTQGAVQVCMSRTNPWPNRNTSSSGGATCQSVSGGSSYTVISLSSSLCSTSYATQCNPIYFSVQSTQQSQQSNPSTCNDPTCEFPNMINYKITHSGLTCYSSALTILASPLLILLMLSAYLINT